LERIGVVLAMEYSGAGEVPRLLVETAEESGARSPSRFLVANPDMVRVIRRVLASGDRVACILEDVPDGSIRLAGFRILAEASPSPGRARHLEIHHTDPPTGEVLGDPSEPGELEDHELAEAVGMEGEYVFHAEYSRDTASVLRWHGSYYYTNDGGTFGPFLSLMAALEWSESFDVPEGIESMKCTELSSEEMGRCLQWNHRYEPGVTIELNGDTWALGPDLIWRRDDPR